MTFEIHDDYAVSTQKTTSIIQNQLGEEEEEEEESAVESEK